MAVTYSDVLANVRMAVEQAPSYTDAMRQAVNVLKEEMPDYSWVGIYLLDGQDLILGPFRGAPSPHTRIPLNQGICGAAASARETIIVDDVDEDPRYLACSLETRSEIVVPILRGSEVLGEIDIDSDKKAAFGPADRELLEAVAALLASKFSDRPPAAHTQGEPA
jgi:L-methionine (R)-S-oxide reductase